MSLSLSLKTSITRLTGALLIAMQVPTMAHAACAGPDDMQSPECRRWIDSKQPLFAARDGKLFKLHFDSLQSDVLVDRGFTSLTFWLSPDTRYIAYTGTSGGRFSAFVHDNADGTDHPLPIPDARLVELEFSPDSHRLAWADVTAQPDRRNIVIMNLADLSIRTIGYPINVQTLGDYKTTEVHWSMDGRQLLVGSVAYPKGAYYQISLPALTIAPIEGRFVFYQPSGHAADAGMHFSNGGHEVAYYHRVCPQWQCQNQGKPAPGESVQIYQNHMMTVTTPQGVERVVARGGCDLCGDASVKVLSWLEDGKYLVYQFRGATYLYGVTEDRTSRLFDPGWQFAWHDDDNRAPSLP